jgi:hypothetical protein
MKRSRSDRTGVSKRCAEGPDMPENQNFPEKTKCFRALQAMNEGKIFPQGRKIFHSHFS